MLPATWLLPIGLILLDGLLWLVVRPMIDGSLSIGGRHLNTKHPSDSTSCRLQKQRTRTSRERQPKQRRKRRLAGHTHWIWCLVSAMFAYELIMIIGGFLRHKTISGRQYFPVL